MFDHSEQCVPAEIRTDTRSTQAEGKRLLVALATLLLVVLCSPVLQSPPPTTAFAPSEITGTWVAEGEGYEGRFFALTSDQLLLGLSTTASSAFPLKAVIERDLPTAARVFELQYASTDGLQSMAIHLHPDGTLRLRNPSNVVWRRESPRPPSASR